MHMTVTVPTIMITIIIPVQCPYLLLLLHSRPFQFLHFFSSRLLCIIYVLIHGMIRIIMMKMIMRMCSSMAIVALNQSLSLLIKFTGRVHRVVENYDT